jgi:hypothetical protein
MIRAGFLDPESRRDLIKLARDGSAAHRLGRRANALVLLDRGLSCSDVAKMLLLDDDTIRALLHSVVVGCQSRTVRLRSKIAALPSHQPASP